MTTRPTGPRGTVRIDQQLCRGTGLCQAMSPALFRLTGAGHAVPVEGELRDDSAVELARSVAECCPMGAVTVEPDHDEDTGARTPVPRER
ncbi:cytochrome [Streptomyces sp. Ru62]|uniref:ferredoxin n=1 Tax=Streptomyces sp. Ru62 TaxID=2080745 RepID=UPI000CDDB006|nr:ferredoxin [Streptomyces sp. Ru62]POX63170.1 cytochrome [Streptomyces sp. Ru62]